jgi:hypothetical protein
VGADRELSHVEVRVSPGADTLVYLDGEAGLPMLVVVAGPLELTIAPGGVGLGAADVEAADLIADFAARHWDKVAALVDRQHGEALVRAMAARDRLAEQNQAPRPVLEGP